MKTLDCCRSRAWNVYLGSRLITTVFFDVSMDSLDVYSSLVEHDGYNPEIVVRPR